MWKNRQAHGHLCFQFHHELYHAFRTKIYESVHHLENSELHLPIYFESPVPSVLVPLHNKDG